MANANCHALLSWAQAGCRAELPFELSRHIAACPSCAKNYESITQVRALVARAPIHRVPARRIESIETLLRTETRFSRLRPAPAPKNRRWIAGAAAAVLVGSVGVAAALVQKREIPAPSIASVSRTIPSVFVVSTNVAPANASVSAADASTAPVLGEPLKVSPIVSGANGSSVRVGLPPVSSASLPDDSAFASAFAELNAGHPGVAASAFDALLNQRWLDASRRADVLYWSSQAHARAGNRSMAEARARTYLNRFPNALRAGETALLLGDYARDRGQLDLARRYYERGAKSTRPTTATRAKKALNSLAIR